jgi:hypothetical protein
VELAERIQSFRERGLEVAALSYDAGAVLADFAARKRIPFPLLSDPESKIIRSFGLLNPEYPEGNLAHGVPYPGTFVVDEGGVIVDKSFEEGYIARRTARSLAARLNVGPRPAAESLAREDARITVRVGQSDDTVFPGNRATLVVEVTLAPGLHAYGAGPHAYRPLRLLVAEDPLFLVHDPVLPPTHPFRFEPLNETVPVYEGNVRILQDVTLADRKKLAPLLETSDPRLDVAGTLEYQLCSHTTCHPPDRLPLRWSLRVRPPELERVPEALRRK